MDASSASDLYRKWSRKWILCLTGDMELFFAETSLERVAVRKHEIVRDCGVMVVVVGLVLFFLRSIALAM